MVLSQLNEKAKMTTKILNETEGIRLNEVAGAMYAFPQITLPQAAVAAAQVRRDVMYAFPQITVVFVVAGS